MILNRFPCRVGTPNQRYCETPEEAIERINKHNGATDIYVTLYNGDNVIDKIVWDFDIEKGSEEKYGSWEEALVDFRKLSEHFDDEGYQHMSVFSGGGLHKYLKSTERTLEKPRGALRSAQVKFQEELDLNTDEQIFGDIERIFRVPNTWHTGKQRYCIPLKPDEIYLDKEDLFELAKNQRFGVDAVTEGKQYPIHHHDEATNFYSALQTGDQIEGDFNPADLEPEGVIFPIYPCITNLLKNQDELETKGHGLGYRRRFLVILHLKETGHTYQECVQILKKYLNKTEFRHCVQKERQPQQVYQRGDLLFPDCDNLMTEIACIHDPPENPCESKDGLYV